MFLNFFPLLEMSCVVASVFSQWVSLQWHLRDFYPFCWVFSAKRQWKSLKGARVSVLLKHHCCIFAGAVSVFGSNQRDSRWVQQAGNGKQSCVCHGVGSGRASSINSWPQSCRGQFRLHHKGQSEVLFYLIPQCAGSGWKRVSRIHLGLARRDSVPLNDGNEWTKWNQQ